MGRRFSTKHPGSFSPTLNDPRLTDLVRTSLNEVVGQDSVLPLKRSLAGEDFGYMSEKVPGVYFHLGAGIEGDFRPYHNPHFDLDESALPLGSAALAAVALNYLHNQG